ncbi:glycosidase [Acutalibacter caecimuris]|uniref:glycosidase n=1 Tax=Acutalibacter caecimuris TaxID=3093657 RepID=UPI002AC99360|nr:glycosidase [Acutalibacter sp. M00118]
MGLIDNHPMLNAYPDSLGNTLAGAVAFLQDERVKGAFSSFYILPSLFCSDLDRGFSVVEYELNNENATQSDLDALRELGIGLKLDFVLNHLSVQSPQFQNLLAHGENSPYRDFFLDWNRFWAGTGEVDETGVLVPRQAYIREMFFRKPGLPVLMVEFPGGVNKPYWNTFYQQVDVDGDGKKRYLGQMDLDIRSPLVREFYRQTLERLAGFGAKIVRLDAFAYAPKRVGAKNFLNEPDIWELLQDITDMATPLGLSLLPEIHAGYGEKIYEKIAAKGYMAYDFFLPGLILDAFETGSGEYLARWAQELVDKGIRTVNMLGCHDGIPALDLKGLLPEERIQRLISVLVQRGGFVKDLHGEKNVYYQVNATYYSALGEDDRRLLLARAIQLFMPGKPQVWYLDLFAGKNDYKAMERAGAGGHKEINRTNLTGKQMREGLEKEVVQKQLALLKFRSQCPVFRRDAEVTIHAQGTGLAITWQANGQTATLQANLATAAFTVRVSHKAGVRDIFQEGAV